jgi:hypothetical protein
MNGVCNGSSAYSNRQTLKKTPLNDLLAASTKAKETIAAACPKETVETTTVQLAVMERRVAGLLDALKIVRPAYDTSYASLDSQQRLVWMLSDRDAAVGDGNAAGG